MPPRAALTDLVPVGACVGTSTEASTDAAVAAAISSASTALRGSPTAALVLCTVDRDVGEVQAALRRHLGDVPVHGATTCAAALTNNGPADNAISILLLHAPGAVAVGTHKADGGDVVTAASKAASEAVSKLDGDVAHFLLFSSPGGEESVLSTLADEYPNVPVFGGSAADNMVEGHWRIFSNDMLFDEGVSLLAIGSNVKFGAALVPPYDPTSRSATITKASSRCLYELDGMPAAKVLREWVGDSINDQASKGGSVIVQCATFPMGVEKTDGKYIGIHAAEIMADGAVGLFAEVEQGETLTVLKGLEDATDSAAAAHLGLQRAYEKAAKAGGLTEPKAGLLIYCGGLSIAVGDRLAESLTGMKDKAPLLGMTAFGEQGCFDGKNVHSNLAVGIALFE